MVKLETVASPYGISFTFRFSWEFESGWKEDFGVEKGREEMIMVVGLYRVKKRD